MEITDLPTLFQIASAQESNAQTLEHLGSIIEYQQQEIEQLKKRWWNKILPKIRSNKSPINPFRVCKEIQDIFIDPYNEIGKNTVVTQGGGNHSIISYAMRNNI